MKIKIDTTNGYKIATVAECAAWLQETQPKQAAVSCWCGLQYYYLTERKFVNNADLRGDLTQKHDYVLGYECCDGEWAFPR